MTALHDGPRLARVESVSVEALPLRGEQEFRIVATSGGSPNVLRAFAEAKRLQLLTIGFAGYDGGAMASGGDVDRCFVVGSDSVHRIQETQAALLHILWQRVQDEGTTR